MCFLCQFFVNFLYKSNMSCYVDIIFKIIISHTINKILSKDENIGNHGYIGASILWIYRRYIGEYFGKNVGRLKIIKNSWKCKKNLILI